MVVTDPNKLTVDAFKAVLQGPEGKTIKDMALALEIIWKDELVYAREDQYQRLQGKILGLRQFLNFATSKDGPKAEKRSGGYV